VGDPRAEGARGRLDTRPGRSNRIADPDAACHPLPPDAATLWHPSVIEETLASCSAAPQPPEVDTVHSRVLFTDVGLTERQGASSRRGRRRKRRLSTFPTSAGNRFDRRPEPEYDAW
jgi:hypothetical protein